MQNTYTLAMRNAPKMPFIPVKGIPCNLTLNQAQELAKTSRANGFDVVAFNTQQEM